VLSAVPTLATREGVPSAVRFLPSRPNVELGRRGILGRQVYIDVGAGPLAAHAQLDEGVDITDGDPVGAHVATPEDRRYGEHGGSGRTRPARKALVSGLREKGT
jgi:hypothetical protein